MTGLIDSHCHIDFPCFDIDREAMLRACRQEGIVGLLVPGVTREQWPKISEMVDSTPESGPVLLPAFGLHPCFMSQHKSSHVEQLGDWLAKDAVAVGEIGLDVWHGDANLSEQIDLFRKQLLVAKELNLPVIVHARKTQDLVLKLVRETGFKSGGILHAFSGSLQQAQRAVDMGFLIGFGGAATYQRARKLRSILVALKLESIVFETDAPDIPPCFEAGGRNTPLNLLGIVEILADVLQKPVIELWQQSSQNLLRVLPRLQQRPIAW